MAPGSREDTTRTIALALIIRQIDNGISVAPQITVEDVPVIATAGFVAIVNNRPDDEEPGQPKGAAVRAAAIAAGLDYTEIPITHAGFGHAQLDAMAAVIAAANGAPILAYCRSGTRSCNLWALACAKSGDAPDALIEKGAAAGYDLVGIRPLLEALSGKA